MPQVAATITVATMAFMGAVHGLVLAWNLSYPVPFDLVLIGSLVRAVVTIAYALNRNTQTDSGGRLSVSVRYSRVFALLWSPLSSV